MFDDKERDIDASNGSDMNSNDQDVSLLIIFLWVFWISFYCLG